MALAVGAGERALVTRHVPGPISWWWYTPLSEMSPIRSPLITEVYWLLLIRQILESHSFDRVIWIGDDATVAKAVTALFARAGVPADVRLVAGRSRSGLSLALLRRIRFSVEHLARYLALRLAGFRSTSTPSADVILTSRFPVLWEVGARRRSGADVRRVASRTSARRAVGRICRDVLGLLHPVDRAAPRVAPPLSGGTDRSGRSARLADDAALGAFRRGVLDPLRAVATSPVAPSSLTASTSRICSGGN